MYASVCVRARAREVSARGGGGARGPAHSRAPSPLGRGGGGGRGGGEGRGEGGGREGGESGSLQPVGLKVTRLVQKTASRKEVTEDEWEKESSSQPLKPREDNTLSGGLPASLPAPLQGTLGESRSLRCRARSLSGDAACQPAGKSCKSRDLSSDQ
ncbi:zinc finger X-linked protein ZXDB-like [Perognathus longimembris pacificus]|uniref:zinc finger X-linked protein ZXDB-like n=1 Tax=Perognathus longimembris pacificus TaxID=214514 RepID=UPI002018F6D0|nr:zinc finger X-linked protein ZXDB-like [Perognathus longimembris pacificus]